LPRGIQLFVLVNAAAQRAVKNKYERSEKKEHWLYYADDKYDVSATRSLHAVFYCAN